MYPNETLTTCVRVCFVSRSLGRWVYPVGLVCYVPMVLNTSFNENEPIVCRPHEALDCFMRTKMDVLVLGDFFVRRD